MSELKCPFCNRNLHKGEDGIYSHLDYMTECKGRLFDGSKELWQELIRTRKALELAITGLKNCKTRDHIGAVCRTPEYVDNVLEQITALDQKDVK